MSENPDHGDLERRLEESWRTNAAAWTRSIREGRIESRETVTNEAIVEAVVACAAGRVLDVGCGEGWLARALADRGIEVVGFDGSADLVRRAEEGGGGPFQHLSYADFAADPGRVGRGFGAAVCNFSLLSSDIAGVLRGCHTVLSAGGALVIQTVHPVFACDEPPYRDGWREERFEGIGEGYGTSMPWFFRTFGTWLAELRVAGFEVVEAREPVAPDTGQPLSLLLVSAAGETVYSPNVPWR